MPDSENFLNQTFATEQFVALTLLRRGGPRRAALVLELDCCAFLLPPWAAVMARDLTPLIPPSEREKRREKKRGEERPNIGVGILHD